MVKKATVFVFGNANSKQGKAVLGQGGLPDTFELTPFSLSLGHLPEKVNEHTVPKCFFYSELLLVTMKLEALISTAV